MIELLDNWDYLLLLILCIPSLLPTVIAHRMNALVFRVIVLGSLVSSFIELY